MVCENWGLMCFLGIMGNDLSATTRMNTESVAIPAKAFYRPR